MKLRSFVRDDTVVISADDSIDRAIGLLEEHRVRHLPVVRNGEPVGMVSEGDVLASVGGLLSEERVSKHDPTVDFAGPTSVREIMTSDVVELSPEHDARDAVQAMLDKNVRAVMIVQDGSIRGIVTETDFLKALFEVDSFVPDTCRERSVADHMAGDVISVSSDIAPFALLRTMGQRCHHLPVVDDGAFSGILSDHDIRRSLAIDKIEKIMDPHEHVRLLEDYDARRIMNTSVKTISPEATIADAARQMVEHKIGALPVVESEKLIGMITNTDILTACVDAFATESTG